MSLPKSSDIPQKLHDFIDKLKQSQDSAKLDFDKNKSLCERATSAYEKSQLTENTLKNYYEKLVETNKYSKELMDELDGTLSAFCRIVKNTDSAAIESKKLVVEVGEVLVFAENLKDQLKKFRLCVEKSPKLVACVDAVLKTLTPNGTIDELVTAFQNAIVALKKAILLHEMLDGACGLHSRINETKTIFGSCCLPLTFEEDKDIDKSCDCHPSSEKACVAKECPDVTEEELCADGDDCKDCCCDYKGFKNEGSVARVCDEFDIQGYANQLEIAKKQAKILRKRAYEWMKCTKEATELSESKYTSSKAAYEAALAAKKC